MSNIMLHEYWGKIMEYLQSHILYKEQPEKLYSKNVLKFS